MAPMQGTQMQQQRAYTANPTMMNMRMPVAQGAGMRMGGVPPNNMRMLPVQQQQQQQQLMQVCVCMWVCGCVCVCRRNREACVATRHWSLVGAATRLTGLMSRRR